MDAPATTAVAREYKTPEEQNLIEFFTECARDGHFLTVKGLIEEAQVDINAHNSLGLTAFQLAYWNKHFQISNLLVQKGTKNLRTDFVLDETVASGPSFKLDPFLEQRRKQIQQHKYDDLLIEFVRQKSTMIVTGLIEEVGADINAVNYFGLTPLKQAIKEGHLAMVDLLISKGVDLNARSTFGETPLMFACSIPYRTEICYRLLNVMTPEERNKFGYGSDRWRELVEQFEKSLSQKMPELPTLLIFSQKAKPKSLSQSLNPEAAVSFVLPGDNKKKRLSS